MDWSEAKPAEGFAHLDDVVEAAALVLAERDGFLRAQAVAHDFHHELPPAADPWREPLADDEAQRIREALAHEFFLRLVEQTQDAVDRLARVDGVQRAEHEVARLGGGHGDLDGLAVAHFADEDDLGRLAQRGAQAIGVAVEIRAEFALVERALTVLVDELDRIFQRDDVVGLGAVDLVENGGERGRLARAGRAGDEHQPRLFPANLLEDRRQVQAFERGDDRVELAHDHADATLLAEDVHTEARLRAELVTAVARAGFEQVIDEAAVVAEEVERDVFGLVGRQRVDGRIDRDGLELAERLDLKRAADGEIQIGNAIVTLEHGSEDGVEFYGTHGKGNRRLINPRNRPAGR